MAATDIERGLSTAEVEERIAAGKINRNMERKTKSVKELIIENLCTLFNLINVILAFLVILTGSFKNLTFLFVVFLNTAIGVIQSMRSKKMVDKLTLLTSKKAIAVRVLGPRRFVCHRRPVLRGCLRSHHEDDREGQV